MGKKNNHISFNQDGETIRIEVKDQTYRTMYRGTYKTTSKKDMYNMLSVIEKFSPYTINQILNWKNDWI